MTSPMPTDSQRRLHVALITAAAVLAAAMVGVAAWTLTRPKPQRVPVVAFTSPGETSGSAAVSATVGASSPATAPSSSGAGSQEQGSQEATHASVIYSAHKIAYRISSVLYVAKEDGTSARPAYGESSYYALSPDGLRIASIESGKLAVIAVGTRPTSKSDIKPGAASADVTPVWTPDSSAVLFVRTGTDGLPTVWRYTVATQALTRVGAGSGASISPDGLTTVALPTEATDSGVLAVWRSDGRSYTVKVPSGDPVAVALANDRIYVSTASAAGDASLWSMSLDGKEHKKLAGAMSAGSTSATYGEILLSPDGKHLLYTVEGDDGYSRIRVVPSEGGSSVAISGRRDGYPLAWTADGSHILFIEGNAYQGQTTALWRCDDEGSHRTELTKNAAI